MYDIERERSALKGWTPTTPPWWEHKSQYGCNWAALIRIFVVKGGADAVHTEPL